jgi:two-component system LytT family response regulator
MQTNTNVGNPNRSYTAAVLLRVLLVDDEPIARKVLRQELDCLDLVEVVGEADNGERALRQICALQPDLVFLDIQMPGMGGFELLTHLGSGLMPVIVMVTAYDKHAIRAFEAGVVDYLLKPISQARLQQALERARRLRRNPQAIAENVAQLQQIGAASSSAGPRIRKIVGKIGEEYFLLDPEEVLAFQADGDLVWVVTNKQRYLAVQNLKTLEVRLDGSFFRRIHRNALVNINQIRKIAMITSQRWLLTLSNGHEFVVSKRQARNVREVLHW